MCVRRFKSSEAGDMTVQRVSKIRSVKKRDGRVVPVDANKIAEAIWKSIKATGGKDRATADQLADKVVELLEKQFGEERIPSVEDVQDIVEHVLIDEGHARTAKAYILYRQKRAEIREEKKKILEKTEIDEVDKSFDSNALKVLRARYLRKDENGHVLESPKELFLRVAVHTAVPSLLYDPIVYSIRGGESLQDAPESVDFTDYQDLVVGGYGLNSYHLDALFRLYKRLNSEGKMKVSWSQLAQMIRSGAFEHHGKEIEAFFRSMVDKRFMPNTPALANFGHVLGMGSACFVLDVDDSIDSIMETLRSAAIIFKAGGGVGYNFSKLRPEGDFVRSTSGIASGPVSFMRLFDTMTEVIKQGGIRRGANMGILNINHPDIEKFIKAKEGNKALRNFNISVLILDDFWQYYAKNELYPLVNPRTKEVVRYVNPGQLLDMIAYQAWESAEPGVIFFDRVNQYNPFVKSLGPIVTTNPCGEVLLYPNESCNLGSINVASFAKEDDEGNVSLDWDALRDTVEEAVRFLDNVIDVNKYPLKEIEDMTLKTRKIGLGVMGVADLFFEMGIPYNSAEGFSFMEKLMEFVNYHSKKASIKLAKERGVLPMFEQSSFKDGKLPFSGFEDPSSWHFDWKELAREVQAEGIRNGYTTIIAPTGSISMISGCSSGIEPVFALVYEKNVSIGDFFYVDPGFEKVMKHEGLYDDDLLKQIVENHGSLRNVSYIPERIKKVFVTAMDIAPEDHVRAIAAFQKWVDSSISKTTNMPADATVEDVKKAYMLAYKLGCKDLTVYRDKSITSQVLRPASSTKAEGKAGPKVNPGSVSVYAAAMPVFNNASSFNSNKNGVLINCPVCGTKLEYKEGCATCPGCGWSLCISA
jgi:ribonucleoside-diphosphate reductase alpha chain